MSLSGWRFRKYPTRKELLDEIFDLLRIRAKLQSENIDLRNENNDLKHRLDIIQVAADPKWDGAVHLKEEL